MNQSFEGYGHFLQNLKDRIRAAQIKAALSVNRGLVFLYWQLGRDILTKQKQFGWGAKVVERLSKDLKREFPSIEGLNPRNLLFMRAFAEAYPNEAIVKRLVSQIPWGHNIRIIQTTKDLQERLWYIQKTIEHGWSRSILEHQIESDLCHRQGKALSNFDKTLPAPQSNLANQILKDPYNFDFLTLTQEAAERDIEKGLLDHIREFLLELGVGFAFVGSQYHLAIGEQDFYLDLLFYHLRLRCFVVLELKWTDFKPEYAGKMNFYLSGVDNLLRQAADNPSIGIILCKSKNKIAVEYSLRDMSKPIGVSAYKLMESLPKTLKGSLPTIKDLEIELAKGSASA